MVRASLTCPLFLPAGREASAEHLKRPACARRPAWTKRPATLEHKWEGQFFWLVYDQEYRLCHYLRTTHPEDRRPVNVQPNRLLGARCFGVILAAHAVSATVLQAPHSIGVVAITQADWLANRTATKDTRDSIKSSPDCSLLRGKG